MGSNPEKKKQPHMESNPKNEKYIHTWEAILKQKDKTKHKNKDINQDNKRREAISKTKVKIIKIRTMCRRENKTPSLWCRTATTGSRI